MSWVAFTLKHWRLVLAGMAIAAALGAAWWLVDTGRGIERAKQDQASVKAYEERTLIDETLSGKSPRELCLAAGGGGGCGRLSDVR